MNIYDYGVKVGQGEFMVDRKAMDRILAVERKKVWRHRAGLLWREFGAWVVVPVASVAAIALLVGYLWLWWGAVKWVGGYSKIVAATVTVLLLPLHIVGVAFAPDMYDTLQYKIKRIRSEWNPPTVGGKEA